jgi:hypothetical protein
LVNYVETLFLYQENQDQGIKGLKIQVDPKANDQNPQTRGQLGKSKDQDCTQAINRLPVYTKYGTLRPRVAEEGLEVVEVPPWDNYLSLGMV